VFLRNGTEDRQVFIDPARDRLVISYSRASGVDSELVVRVAERTLGPGEETEAVFVALEERAGPARVEFESTDQAANSRLVARTAFVLP
jgi:hypothetical protein